MNDSHKSPSEILQGAYHALLRLGWTKGAYFEDKKCCLVGALQLAAYGNRMGPADSDQELAKQWAYRYIEDVIDPGPDGTDLEAWNDAPGRTIQELRHVLITAYHLAKVKGQ